MMVNFSKGPQFQGDRGRMWPELRRWVWQERLPWLIEQLGLPAADALPQIDWQRNNIFVSPPGTGKNVVLVPAALEHYQQVYVLVPSVVQAHRAKDSLDKLFHPLVGGCFTSQLVEDDLIDVITTGIFHQLVRDRSSLLWQKGTILFVDEAQRILDNDVDTEFLLGYFARHGGRVAIMSATIDPNNLRKVYDAEVHELKKQMHPIKIEQVQGVPLEKHIKAVMPEWVEQGRTSLTFCPSRARVAHIGNYIRSQFAGSEDEPKIGVVTVTGADDVSRKEAEIVRWNKKGVPLAIVGTPGVLDSSVTIPGLSRIIIEDDRIDVNFNQFGFREMVHEPVSVNNIWQMIRRCGREKRAQGGEDEVFVLTSSDRSKDLSPNVKFEQIRGAHPNTPIAKLVLESIYNQVLFSEVHDYMVSNFPASQVEEVAKSLSNDEVIEHADTATGWQITDKGRHVLELPFDYAKSKAVVEAPDELKLFVALAFSFGPLYNYRDFETEYQVVNDTQSELLTKVRLGIDYWNFKEDEYQEQLAEQKGLSWRRMESVESLFLLALHSLEIEPPDVIDPEELDVVREELIAYFCKCDFFHFYILQKNSKGWSAVMEYGGQRRIHVAGKDCQLDFAGSPVGEHGFCAIIADPIWFESRAGNPMANLNDITIVPIQLAQKKVAELAEMSDWKIMEFQSGTDPQGRGQMECVQNGKLYLPNRFGAQPKEGKKYWVEIDRDIGRDIWLVNLKYPVL